MAMGTVTPADVGRLVEGLRKPWGGTPNSRAERDAERYDAATALEAQAAELAAVKTALDCALIRECNEKHRAKIAHQSMNAAINTRERAETALAEARKALEEIGNGCDGRIDKDALPCRIARRALTGG